jgi:hypothetical protein
VAGRSAGLRLWARLEQLAVAWVSAPVGWFRRSQGIGGLELVEAVVLETDGSFSVIPDTQAGSGSALKDLDPDAVMRVRSSPGPLPGRRG